VPGDGRTCVTRATIIGMNPTRRLLLGASTTKQPIPQSFAVGDGRLALPKPLCPPNATRTGQLTHQGCVCCLTPAPENWFGFGHLICAVLIPCGVPHGWCQGGWVPTPQHQTRSWNASKAFLADRSYGTVIYSRWSTNLLELGSAMEQ
jgi:hypothetical protein